MIDVDPVVKVSGLTQYINDHKVLDGISFQVDPGRLFVLTGPSGAGKTVLISILAGIQAFKSGTVEVMGHVAGGRKGSYKQHIGLVTQQYSLFENFTAGENLTVIGMMRGMAARDLNRRTDQLVDSLGLEEFLRRTVRTLPWGPKQRLALACAMLAGPKLLLVDEILSGDDYQSVVLILKNIVSYINKGNTCVWATGRLREAALIAEGQPGMAELARTGVWDKVAPGDNVPAAGNSLYAWPENMDCPPGAIGCLHQGKLSVYSPGEFTGLVSGKGTGPAGNGRCQT